MRFSKRLLAGIASCALLVLSGSAGAQETKKTMETRHFEVISVDGNKVVYKSEAGIKEVTLNDDFKLDVDGKTIAVKDLKPGMKGTAVITTTTTTTPVTVTEVRNAKVLATAGNAIIVRGQNGVRKFTIDDVQRPQHHDHPRGREGRPPEPARGRRPHRDDHHAASPHGHDRPRGPGEHPLAGPGSGGGSRGCSGSGSRTGGCAGSRARAQEASEDRQRLASGRPDGRPADRHGPASDRPASRPEQPVVSDSTVLQPRSSAPRARLFLGLRRRASASRRACWRSASSRNPARPGASRGCRAARTGSGSAGGSRGRPGSGPSTGSARRLRR